MKTIVKKLMPQIFLMIVLCISSLVFNAKDAVFAKANIKQYKYTVIVDAGHGGFDGGAVAIDGTSEKNINLKIAEKLKSMLELNGVNVIMTRESDTAINDYGTKIHTKKKSDMQNRLEFMEENPDAVFVSIHLNKFTTSAASGAQVFYSDNFEDSGVLAESIKHSIVTLLEPENNRSIKKGTSSTYLLYNAKIPAVLVECGFLSNKRDLENLKSDEFQAKMAFAISEGILNYYKED